VTPLIDYLKDYLRNISVKSLILTSLFIALLITLNYTVGIERRIRDIRRGYLSWLGFFFFYGFVLFFAWAVQFNFQTRASSSRPASPSRFGAAMPGRRFLLLLGVAPLFFASKMVHWDLSALLPGGWHYPWNRYALTIMQLPAKLLILLLLLYGCWKLEKGHLTGAGPFAERVPMGENLVMGRDTERLSFWGLTTRNFSARPYLLMLLFLLPLVALASTQHDFLHTYPKIKNIAFIGGYTKSVWPWRLLYEISYGLDFVSIELFFRGFLVIGLGRYAGQYAILPMAAFYCTIHFGKPLGECISSFFGGLALGVVAWRTRSILGGLIVHLGLAWMMEVGGWLGNLFF
jgi:Type II CAAX prenyl endopeptidase Rce1-like